jgi:hemolysin activation/secretion protein
MGIQRQVAWGGLLVLLGTMAGLGGIEGAIAAPKMTSTPIFKIAAPLKADWQSVTVVNNAINNQAENKSPNWQFCKPDASENSTEITLRIDVMNIQDPTAKITEVKAIPSQVDAKPAQVENRIFQTLNPNLQQLKAKETLDIIRQLAANEVGPDSQTKVQQLRLVLNNLLLNSGFITSSIEKDDLPRLSRAGNVVSIQFKVQLGQLLEIHPWHVKPGKDELNKPLPLERRWRRYICRRILQGVTMPLNANQIEDQLRLLREDPAIDSIEGTLRESLPDPQKPSQRICSPENEARSPKPNTGQSEQDSQQQNGQRQSCLEIRVVKAKPYITNIGADNYSPPSVGSVRGAVDLQFFNVGMIGSELALGYANSFTGGNEAASFSYRTPLSKRNNTVQVRFVRSRNKITDTTDNIDELGIRGTAELYDVAYRHPLFRTPTKELALSLGGTVQNGKSFIADDPFQFFQGAENDGSSRTSVIKFVQEYLVRSPRSAFALRSQFNLGTDLFGLFDVTQNRDPIPDSFFFSWFGQAQWLQRFGRQHLLISQLELQLTPDTLLPSQQFVIGGGQSVRGYRQNARYGDNGLRVAIEDRITLWNLDEDYRYRDRKGCLPEDYNKKNSSQNENTSNRSESPPPQPSVPETTTNITLYRTRLHPNLPILPEVNCQIRPRDISAYIAPFFDIGKVWNNNNPNQPLTNSLLYSAGIGLGLETGTSSKNRRPSYSMRLDFALPFVAAATRGGDFQDLGIYFSFRYRF